LVARLVREQKVVGSSPVASTKIPVLGRKMPENGLFYAKFWPPTSVFGYFLNFFG